MIDLFRVSFVNKTLTNSFTSGSITKNSFVDLLRSTLVLVFLLVIPLVWSENSSNYDYYTRSYTDTTGEAFWYSLLTLIIWVVVVRLIKITFLYIALAQKPQWKKEFKKFF